MLRACINFLTLFWGTSRIEMARRFAVFRAFFARRARCRGANLGVLENAERLAEIHRIVILFRGRERRFLI